MDEYSSKTGSASDDHAHAERPPSAPFLQSWPQEEVSGQLDGSGQEEVEELVAAERRGVVREADVDARVGEPDEGDDDGLEAQVGGAEEVGDAVRRANGGGVGGVVPELFEAVGTQVAAVDAGRKKGVVFFA